MRKSSLIGIVALGTAGALALTACSNSKSGDAAGLNQGSASKGGAADQMYKIGYEGPLSGDNQQIGINQVNAIQLAVDQANASGKLGFKLGLLNADDVGTPDKAPAAAASLLQDTTVMAVVGPQFSGATKAVGKTYAQAKMALISASATNGALTSSGFTTFHRIVPPDSVEGTQTADWIAKKAKKVFVMDDLGDYGKGVADDIQKQLKAKGVAVIRQGVDAKTTDYGAIAQSVNVSGAQAIFYGGYDAQAGQLARSLKTVGYNGIKVTGNGAKSGVFTKGAGDAGDGWYFSCGCLDATVAPAAKAFTDAYTAKYNLPPQTYSPEAYDAANALIQVIKDLVSSGGPVTRAAVATGVNKVNYTGITTVIKFQPNGEVQQQIINLYQQKSGKIGLLGNIKAQT